MANAISSLKFGDNTYVITTPYATCNTAAGTAAKVATLTSGGSFALETGSRVLVKFTVANIASSPRLNVGGTGAKAIFYRGSAIPADAITANETYEFVYNGTQWDFIGDIDTNTNTAHGHTAGTGLTISGSGGGAGTTTYSANLNSTTSLGTIGTTSKLYAVGVDANGKLCVSVPWTDTNTTYSFSNNAPTLSWGTTSTVGTVGGVALTVKMPSNPNTDTHYTTGINAGASGATSNSAASDPYITVKDNSTYRSQIRLVGSGATAVSSDSNGNITISSTNTTYSAGTGLSLSSTTFSVNTGFTTSGKNYKVAVDTTSGGLYVNVPWTNTTYSAATTSAAGLMSAADKVKLDGITDSADSVSFSRSLTSGTKIGTITINGTGTDLYCQTDTNTVYYAGTGISLRGTTFSNAGVRSITTGSSQGTISVNTNGTSAEVSVSGLNTAAYYSYSTFALANHTHSNYFSTSGGTISGATTISSTATYPFSIVNNTNTIFKVNKVGQTYADGAYYATGADYAEYMEWNDQNSLDQDRRGLFVVMEYDTGLIRLANEEDDVDDIIGIVSGTPSTVGNSAEMHWCKKYVTDVFGNVQMETIVQPKYVDKYGNTIPEQTIEVPLLNPEYDPNIEYIPRSKRKEWVVIGLMGQIIMVDDGTCVVGRRCRNTTNGMATLSETKEGWRVIERLDENHIRVLFK